MLDFWNFTELDATAPLDTKKDNATYHKIIY